MKSAFVHNVRVKGVKFLDICSKVKVIRRFDVLNDIIIKNCEFNFSRNDFQTQPSLSFYEPLVTHKTASLTTVD